MEVTTPGNIDLTTQISDTLTAQGDKSVKVTQTSGDIKIGKVASKGNVTLTASNGAIVNSVDTAVNMTGAADKIAAWQAAGLISDKDSDNSATNSAQAEKNIRLAGLENLLKRWALKDDGTIDETLYNQFINNTADQTKLTDEQINQLELYQDLQNSTDYGFSKNQLLYAVQESLLNPSAGITASISDPIITGKLTANALNNIAINADFNLLVNNVTSGSNATLTAKGNISSGGKFIVNAPNVNLTATNNIGTQSIPLFILAEDTALKAKYAYIMGDYGNLNASPDTKVMVGSNGEAAGSPESAGGNNSNISYYSPAQSPAEPTSPTNEAAPITNTYEPLNTPNVINSTEPANTTPKIISLRGQLVSLINSRTV